MEKIYKPFNNSSLKPFNNPKDCEKLYLEKNAFFPYVYALKWNYLDCINYLSNFNTKSVDEIFKAAYLLNELEGANATYNFIKEYGKFDSILYKSFYNTEFFIFLLKLFRKVGSDDDIKFIISLLKSQFSTTLSKALDTPDIYTHASLHALIVSILRERNISDFLYSNTTDAVVLDINNDELILSSILGNEINVDNSRSVKIAAMMRVRNEEDNIKVVINSISEYVDLIIIYDDFSQDRTVSIIKECQSNGLNIELIEGSEWLFNEALIHQILVDKGREKGVSHFIQIDGDEVLSKFITPEILRKIMQNMKPGDILALPWLNVTEDISGYYSEEQVVGLAPSRSLKRFKDIAFADDGFSQYSEWTYSHVNVAPFTYTRRIMSLSDQVSLLHLEQLNLVNFAAKKDWYRIRAFSQNKKLPADPYLDIRLNLLQLKQSIKKFDIPVSDLDSSHLELLSKNAYGRIESNIEGCRLFPQLKLFMYIDYDYFDLTRINNISEK